MPASVATPQDEEIVVDAVRMTFEHRARIRVASCDVDVLRDLVRRAEIVAGDETAVAWNGRVARTEAQDDRSLRPDNGSRFGAALVGDVVAGDGAGGCDRRQRCKCR